MQNEISEFRIAALVFPASYLLIYYILKHLNKSLNKYCSPVFIFNKKTIIQVLLHNY